MTEDTRAWRCACGARGTLAYETVSDEPDERGTFHCPKCGRELEDCRPTRRARRTPKNTADDGPIAVADPRPLSDQEIAQSGSEWEWTQLAQQKLDLRGVTVLVVEDHPDSRDMLRQVVESFGASVAVAADGRQALGAISWMKPDLILCDPEPNRIDYETIAAQLERIFWAHRRERDDVA